MEFIVPEGATPIKEDDLAALIPTHISTMAELNEWEGVNILAAEEWLFGRRHRDVLNDGFVRDLHRRMFNETWRWAGQYRRTDTNPGIHWPLIPVSVRQVCDNTAYLVEHGTLPLDEIAARFHHSMVVVHPFPNGNGRHTRLLADALLFVSGQPRFTWGRGDLQSEKSETRARYLHALKEADNGDFAPLLAFVRS